MAETFKILAQSSPGATSSTNLYTVPASTNTSISSITVCNRSATATTFRISVAVNGATLADNQYIYFDQAIDGNSTFVATIGITLSAADVIRVYSGAATLTFIAFGVEVS
jgi:hypothetical protein